MTRIIHRNPVAPPPLAVKAQGCFIYDQSGKAYYDASGGAAVSCIGHGHPEVVEAITTQLEQLDYAHTGFFTSKAAEELAELISSQSPALLRNVYFVSSGSEAVETALKMARQYHVDQGKVGKHQFISRRQSYHGNTLGALGVGGNLARRHIYEPLLKASIQVNPCFSYRYKQEGESDIDYAERLANELEETILFHGAENIAGFIAETVVGATSGAVAPVASYFQKIQAVCKKYDVLLILDEVMSGMGRTGSYHAFELEGVIPDILCLAKGLGGGYQPIGAVIATDNVIEVINSNSGAFKHGHTYVGHPVACAGALAVQKIILRDELVSRSKTLGDELLNMLQVAFQDHPNVGEVRGRGLFCGVELVQNKVSKKPFDASLAIHAKTKAAAFELGLLCYPGGGTIDGLVGDHVLLAPPYTTTSGQLKEMVSNLKKAIDIATIY